MSDDRSPDNNVEMPDVEDTSLPVATGGLKTSHVVLLLMVLAVLVFAGFYFFVDNTKETIKASRPEIDAIYIVSRLEGETVATDKNKLIRDGRGVMLYLIAHGYDETRDKWFYYTQTPYEDPIPDIEINGKRIDGSEVRLFKFFDINSLVFWYKWEVVPFYYENEKNPHAKRAQRSISMNHNLDDEWWAIADVRNERVGLTYEYAGTVHLTASLQVFPQDDPRTVLSDVDTANSEVPEGSFFPANYHRITRIPRYRDGLNATYRAFFNLYTFEDIAEEGIDPWQATLEFEAGTSRSILAGAIKLLGREVNDYQDEAFLEQHAERIFSNIILDDYNYFRFEGDESTPIRYGDGGVKIGDILVIGDRYMVLDENNADNEPAFGALTWGDIVLDAYNGMVRSRALGPIIAEMEGQPMEIWRLRKPEPAGSQTE